MHLATAFAADSPYAWWQQHACGINVELLTRYSADTAYNDGPTRANYMQRMAECPRCWAGTNLEDELLVPPIGTPVPSDAKESNCFELSPGDVPEWVWAPFSGEFVMVDRFGDDERPYMETQGTDWFTIWAFGNVANYGLGSHITNVVSEGGGRLNFHLWIPFLPPVLSDPCAVAAQSRAWASHRLRERRGSARFFRAARTTPSHPTRRLNPTGGASGRSRRRTTWKCTLTGSTGRTTRPSTPCSGTTTFLACGRRGMVAAHTPFSGREPSRNLPARCAIQADGLRHVSILETGGYMAFHYQWLKGQARRQITHLARPHNRSVSCALKHTAHRPPLPFPPP